MGFYKNGDANCVTFYNWTDISPDFVIPSVTKYWDDNDNVFQKRPKEIKVNLLQNGTKVSSIPTVKLNKSNNWTFTLPEKDALPKYDDADQEYVYTWEEDTSALPKDYELTDTKILRAAMDNTPTSIPISPTRMQKPQAHRSANHGMMKIIFTNTVQNL